MSNEAPPSSALDLNQEPPRSPRALLGGYVIAGRTLDKCRARLAGTAGPYNFGGLLDQFFFEFTQIAPEAFEAFIATGASDEAIAIWIQEHATSRPEGAIVQWNNRMRELRISELPQANQLFLERYIPEHLPNHRPPYCWFDVYDLEEGRL